MEKVIFKNNNYQIPRQNRCCVCGKEEDLTRHHIIPTCYINKLFKDVYKDLREVRFYYEWDYCCSCRECHSRYEKEYSKELHEAIRVLFNINLKETSYKQPYKGLPKPSELVMKQIKNKADYLKLRDFCIKFFIEKMEPKYSVLSGR